MWGNFGHKQEFACSCKSQKEHELNLNRSTNAQGAGAFRVIKFGRKESQ